MRLSSEEISLLKGGIPESPKIAETAINSWLQKVGVKSGLPWNQVPHVDEISLLPSVISNLSLDQISQSPHKGILQGISKSTWLNNISLIKNSLDIYERLSERTEVVIFKGASLVSHAMPTNRRRLNDIDVIVPFEDTELALDVLKDNEFIPQFGIKKHTILSREIYRRSGWNFENSQGARIDLHWNLFGNEINSKKLNHRFWSQIKRKNLLGNQVSVPDLGFILAYNSYHSRVRSPRAQSLSLLSDLVYFFDKVEMSDLESWAVDSHHHLWIIEDFKMIKNLILMQNDIEVATLPIPNSPKFPWSEVRKSQLRKKLVNLSTYFIVKKDLRFIRSKATYIIVNILKLWNIVERVLCFFSPLTKSSIDFKLNNLDIKEFDFSNGWDYELVATGGWQWDPLEKITWADASDSRLLFKGLKSRRKYKLHIKIDEQSLNSPREDGKFSANPYGKIYANGKKVSEWNFWDRDATTDIECIVTSSYFGFLEFSFQPRLPISPRHLNAIYNGWLRSIPVLQVKLDRIN
jgi:hypothetical protein